ncbi:hypothetical protein PULV_a1468 [Pseudoalteromonas ulvae UL12]|nr:hypothetical protein [Pseudoalteromonas ulvae UL12]
MDKLLGVFNSWTSHINPVNSPILARLNIAPENWLTLTTQFTKVFHGAVGRPKKLYNYCANLELKRRANYHQCEKLLA